MKIENIERAQDLIRKRDELQKISGLLAGAHSMIIAYETTSTNSNHESTWDPEVKAALAMVVSERVAEIEKEIETL